MSVAWEKNLEIEFGIRSITHDSFWRKIWERNLGWEKNLGTEFGVRNITRNLNDIQLISGIKVIHDLYSSYHFNF